MGLPVEFVAEPGGGEDFGVEAEAEDFVDKFVFGAEVIFEVDIIFAPIDFFLRFVDWQ